MRMATAFLLLSTCRGLLYIFGAFSQTQKVSFERRSLSVSFTGLLVSFTTRISIVVTLKKHCIDSLIHSCFLLTSLSKTLVVASLAREGKFPSPPYLEEEEEEGTPFPMIPHASLAPALPVVLDVLPCVPISDESPLPRSSSSS